MPNFPKCVQIKEERPREGFQINDKGMEWAIATKRLTVKGSITLCASETFLERNQNRTSDQQLDAQLPGSVMVGGSLSKLRRKVAA